jgi:hypothetical protein
LIGEDVITAHRLLKNEIPYDEYILLSEDVMSQYDRDKINGNFDWSLLEAGQLEVEHIGKITFHYINLKPLSH